jgi:hypothetical protein
MGSYASLAQFPAIKKRKKHLLGSFRAGIVYLSAPASFI